MCELALTRLPDRCKRIHSSKHEASLKAIQVVDHRVSSRGEPTVDVSGANSGNRSNPAFARNQTGPHSVRLSTSPVNSSWNTPRRHEYRDEAARGDLKLHVGGGNVMSYRWVSRAVRRSAYDGTALGATKALSRQATGLHTPHKEEFLLIVLPDLFMTMDSMDRGLEGIFDKKPQGRLLLVRIEYPEYYLGHFCPLCERRKNPAVRPLAGFVIIKSLREQICGLQHTRNRLFKTDWPRWTSSK